MLDVVQLGARGYTANSRLLPAAYGESDSSHGRSLRDASLAYRQMSGTDAICFYKLLSNHMLILCFDISYLRQFKWSNMSFDIISVNFGTDDSWKTRPRMKINNIHCQVS